MPTKVRQLDQEKKAPFRDGSREMWCEDNVAAALIERGEVEAIDGYLANPEKAGKGSATAAKLAAVAAKQSAAEDDDPRQTRAVDPKSTTRK